MTDVQVLRYRFTVDALSDPKANSGYGSIYMIYLGDFEGQCVRRVANY